MKINSINTYNQVMKTKSNPNFGMAKFVDPEIIVKLSEEFRPDLVLKTINDVPALIRDDVQKMLDGILE